MGVCSGAAARERGAGEEVSCAVVWSHCPPVRSHPAEERLPNAGRDLGWRSGYAGLLPAASWPSVCGP